MRSSAKPVVLERTNQMRRTAACVQEANKSVSTWQDGDSFDGAINHFRGRTNADAMDEVGGHIYSTTDDTDKHGWQTQIRIPTGFHHSAQR